MRLPERGEPEPVAVLVQVTGVVERYRLEEHGDAAVDLRGGDARPQHRGRIVRPGGRCDHEPRDVTKHPDGVVIVEVAAEALLVAVAGDPDHDAVPVAALGEELQCRRLSAQLVLRVVQVGEVLDLGYRHEAGDRRPERQSENRCLVEQGVEHAPGAEPRMQATGDAVDAALRRHVLAEDEKLGRMLEPVGERRVDALRERQRAPVGPP